MKLKIISIGSMLSVVTCACFAGPITMPSAEVLKERLEKIGVADFAQNTTIISELAEQQKEPFGVYLTLDLAIENYQKKVAKPVAKAIEMHQSLILKTLLQDHPEALKQLAAEGFYEAAKL